MDVTDAHLRQLVTEGLSQREIARRTGISRTTLQRRLQRLGLTAGQAPVPVQTPVQHTDTDAVQTLDTGAVQRLDQLEEEVQGLRQLMHAVIDRLEHPPAQTPVQITALPPYPKGKAVRWNLWMQEEIREALVTWAAERGISPSQLVQEVLWQALTDRRHPP